MKKAGFKLSLLAMAFSTAMLTGCNSSDETFDLKIAHINDHHSHLDADSVGLTINEQEVELTSGGFARVVKAIDTIEAASSTNNFLKLHAGDAITGTLYYSLFRGEADAAMMNEVCFDAFALGNHEFDDSDAGLKTFLDFLNPSVDASCPETPVLAANVTPSLGTPLAPNATDDYIKPYIIKEMNGEKVGIIGIDIVNKTVNSSSPLETTVFTDEVATAQAKIYELQGQGVNKIILMTHYQYENDLAMAAQLDGVDVIIGGDSHTLLGDFEQYGLNPAGDYPTQVTDASGNKVCVAQAWQYAQVVGELDVTFDENGVVTSCSGTPHLLVEVDSNMEINGEAATETEQANMVSTLASINNLTVMSEDTDAVATLATFKAQTDVLKATKIGEASEDLCLERIPGQGRSSICTAAETLPHGGDIQMIVAHAFREMALASDIAIQNAGGVRIDVPAGDLSIDTAYTLLPFSNTIVELTMTGAQIKSVLEEAIENAIKPDGSTGAYPYAAGLRWDADLTQAAGSRISNLEFKGRDDTAWVALNDTQTYKVATNDYIAGGKDGYLTFAEITGDNYVDTYLDYAQSFVDYVKDQEAQGNSISRLPYSEYSTQNFTDADGNFYATQR